MYAAAGALPYYVFKPKPASQTGHKLTSLELRSQRSIASLFESSSLVQSSKGKKTSEQRKAINIVAKNLVSYCKMHIDKCIRFYRVVKRLMYCGSVKLCQFDSFWVPFNTTNRVVRVAWIALNAKLTFLGPYLHSSRECIVFTRWRPLSWGQFCLSGAKVNNVIKQTAFLEYRYNC